MLRFSFSFIFNPTRGLESNFILPAHTQRKITHLSRKETHTCKHKGRSAYPKIEILNNHLRTVTPYHPDKEPIAC